jgi:hypothetical protein
MHHVIFALWLDVIVFLTMPIVFTTMNCSLRSNQVSPILVEVKNYEPFKMSYLLKWILFSILSITKDTGLDL